MLFSLLRRMGSVLASCASTTMGETTAKHLEQLHLQLPQVLTLLHGFIFSCLGTSLRRSGLSTPSFKSWVGAAMESQPFLASP
jgi:hypothetical protein